MDRRTWAMLGKSVSAGLLAGLLTAKVNSAVLVDFSPDFIGASVGCCVAQAEGTYLQHFDLSQSTTLTGFAYYVENNGHVPAVGNQLFVTITQGPFQVGQPPASSVYHFLTVTVASNQFPGATASNYGDFYGLTGVFAPLPSILLAAGTYWVGFNGDSGAFAPATFGFALLSGQNAPFNDPMPVLDATGKYGTPASPPVGTMAMRLYGDVVTVPEPGTLALLAGSVALFGLIGRRRLAVKMPKN